jgi:hypothetical protein
MFNLNKLNALLLTVSVAFTASSQAATVTVEQLTDAMLAETVAATQSELNNSIQGAILSAANMFSLEEQEVYATYATRVTITDLSSESDKKTAKRAE